MSDTGPGVRTTSGVVSGRTEAGLAVFRGIPYAQPPSGALRFGAPERVSPWEGTRNAVMFGPRPPQSGPLRAAGFDGPDWLTVNVWSPDLGAARLPVLVWIYGGFWVAGSAGDPQYDPAPIASHGVVVVSFNYRVGAEGFAQLDGAPANRGLLDQVAALHWVRENIAGFGGDPENVTLCGQSAGAASIATLLGMPMADGLFRRAIAQSVPGGYYSAALAADVAEVLAGRLGHPPTAAALAEIDPLRLAREVDLLSAELPAYTERWGPRRGLFAPVVDGDTVMDVPWRTLADGRAAGVELLTGHTRDEYRLFLAVAGQLGAITDQDAETALRDLAPAGGGEAYRKAHPHASAARLFELVHSDAVFRMPTLHLAESHVAAGGTAYLYELCWPPPGQGNPLGASHALDLLLLFDTHTTPLAQLLLGESHDVAEAVEVGHQMRRAWAAFATHGDPGWPAYQPDHRLTRLFGTNPHSAPYPEEASRRIWVNHDPTPLELLGQPSATGHS